MRLMRARSITTYIYKKVESGNIFFFVMVVVAVVNGGDDGNEAHARLH